MRTTTHIDPRGASDARSPVEAPCGLGEVIAGKYEILHLIGSGGMGYVYAARTLRGDQKVAIKVLHPQLLANVEQTERFLREARATARLSSEHVVRVLDVGKRHDDGLPYMVMEYLEGEDLGEWLQRLGPFPIDLAVHFVVQVCRALETAHEAGIVHRDIKPSNLLLVRQPGGDAFLKLLDFGISKAIETGRGGGAITETSAVFGSPSYMSPEQVRSAKNVDTRTDVWAIGVVLYELLCGVTPFDGETPGAILAAIVADAPRDLHELRPEVPLGLVQIIDRCLQKDREARLPSAAELGTLLLPYLHDSQAPGSVSGTDLTRQPLRTVRMEGNRPSSSSRISASLLAAGLPASVSSAPPPPPPPAPRPPIPSESDAAWERGPTTVVTGRSPLAATSSRRARTSTRPGALAVVASVLFVLLLGNFVLVGVQNSLLALQMVRTPAVEPPPEPSAPLAVQAPLPTCVPAVDPAAPEVQAATTSHPAPRRGHGAGVKPRAPSPATHHK